MRNPAKKSVGPRILNIIRRLKLCIIMSCCEDQYICKKCLIKDEKNLQSESSLFIMYDVRRMELHFAVWRLIRGHQQKVIRK